MKTTFKGVNTFGSMNMIRDIIPQSTPSLCKASTAMG